MSERKGRYPANVGQVPVVKDGERPGTSTGTLTTEAATVQTQLHAQQLRAAGMQAQLTRDAAASNVGGGQSTQVAPVMPPLQPMPVHTTVGQNQQVPLPGLQPAPSLQLPASTQMADHAWALNNAGQAVPQFYQPGAFPQPYVGYPYPYPYAPQGWGMPVSQSEAPLPPSPSPTPPPPPSASVSVAESQAGSSVMGDSVEEPEDIVATVIGDSTFEERIAMVGDILETELPTIKRQSANFAMSVTKTADAVFKRLPPSANFECKFDEFIQELSAAEGSRRAKSGKRKQPYEVGMLPARVRPKMQFYEIGDRPWLVQAPEAQKNLFNKSIYRGSTAPPIAVSTERLMDWESMNRENVSVLSHVDHFIAAGQRLFESLYDKTERGEKLEPEMIWNIARQGICMMHSAGMGIQDMVRNEVWQIGEQVITRRDAWLSKCKEKIPPVNIDQLRFSSLNNPCLFDPNSLEEAIKAASVQKHEKVQDEMLSKVSNLSRPGGEKSSSNKEKFVKQSFQNFHGKQESSNNSGNKGKSQEQGYNQKPQGKSGQGSNNNGNRGQNHGNRGRKHSGGFKKKQFSNY